MFGILHSATTNPVEGVMDAKRISYIPVQRCHILVSIKIEVM
jgi:hypothetical protein